MTLAEMSDYVCEKVGQTDEESVAACRTFLQRRHQLIWDSALWADSQALVTVAGSGAAHSTIVFPSNVSRVIRLRNVGTEMDVLGTSIGTLFDYDSSIFSETGSETKFIHLPATPVLVDIAPGQLSFSSSGNDTVSIVGGDSLGGILRETVSMAGGSQEVTRIDFTGLNGAHFDTSGTTGVGLGFVLDGGGGVYGIWIDISGSSLAAPDFSGSGATSYASVVVNSSDTATDIASTVASVLNGATFGGGANTQYWTASADGAVVIVEDISVAARTDAADVTAGVTITISTQGADISRSYSVNSYYQLYSVIRPIGYSNTAVSIYDGGGNLVGTIAASETAFPTGATGGVPPPRQRVQVYPAPSSAQTYLAHVKTICNTLSLDSDIPTLDGCENTLLAFAQADMLERQRQYGKAAAKMQEAHELLSLMLSELEKNQQAYDCRIIPADIHGVPTFDGTFGEAGKGFW